ncbi:MAG: CAP domain-containing protein [Pyrinomonadaceae bacterium]|nr:CAP domain-containing protein [Pyrinomonadaceae bacterium]
MTKTRIVPGIALIAIFVLSNISVFADDHFANSILFNGSSASKFSSSERKIFNLVNEERTKLKKGTLDWDTRLAALARSYSAKMANENFFGHRDSKGKSLLDRINDFKISNWSGIGENLYSCEGYDDPTQPAVNGWMNSSGHRSNMLKSSWKYTGIGVARSSTGKIYVTQVFMN